jgi:hypothetical protein
MRVYTVSETIVSRKQYEVIARSERDALRMVGCKRKLRLEPMHGAFEYPLSVEVTSERISR